MVKITHQRFTFAFAKPRDTGGLPKSLDIPNPRCGEPSGLHVCEYRSDSLRLGGSKFGIDIRYSGWSRRSYLSYSDDPMILSLESEGSIVREIDNNSYTPIARQFTRLKDSRAIQLSLTSR